MPQLSEKQKQLWRKNILNQRESGLSIAHWCRENNVKNHNFYYWKHKLFPMPNLDRSDFAEVVDEKKYDSSGQKRAGITLEYRGIRLYLDKKEKKQSPQRKRASFKRKLAGAVTDFLTVSSSI